MSKLQDTKTIKNNSFIILYIILVLGNCIGGGKGKSTIEKETNYGDTIQNDFFDLEIDSIGSKETIEINEDRSSENQIDTIQESINHTISNKIEHSNQDTLNKTEDIEKYIEKYFSKETFNRDPISYFISNNGYDDEAMYALEYLLSKRNYNANINKNFKGEYNSSWESPILTAIKKLQSCSDLEEKNITKVISVLKKYGATLSESEMLDLANNLYEYTPSVIKILLEFGADSNMKIGYGRKVHIMEKLLVKLIHTHNQKLKEKYKIAIKTLVENRSLLSSLKLKNYILECIKNEDLFALNSILSIFSESNIKHELLINNTYLEEAINKITKYGDNNKTLKIINSLINFGATLNKNKALELMKEKCMSSSELILILMNLGAPSTEIIVENENLLEKIFNEILLDRYERDDRKNKYKKIITPLLENGVMLNYSTKIEYIKMLIKFEYADIIKLLISTITDINLNDGKDIMNHTLDLMVNNGDINLNKCTEIIEIFIEKGIILTSTMKEKALSDAINENSEKAFKEIFELKSKKQLSLRQKNRLLDSLIRTYSDKDQQTNISLDIINILIKKGAEIKHTSQQQITPLVLFINNAINHSNFSIIKLILEQLSKQYSDGAKPLINEIDRKYRTCNRYGIIDKLITDALNEDDELKNIENIKLIKIFKDNSKKLDPINLNKIPEAIQNDNIEVLEIILDKTSYTQNHINKYFNNIFNENLRDILVASINKKDDFNSNAYLDLAIKLKNDSPNQQPFNYKKGLKIILQQSKRKTIQNSSLEDIEKFIDSLT